MLLAVLLLLVSKGNNAGIKSAVCQCHMIKKLQHSQGLVVFVNPLLQNDYKIV
jgi:hypothetical protein